jgi:fructan beta-fructosidase
MARDQWNRPRYHFTPQQNWMNDPNGLVYDEGEYHLFYQHNPYAATWGHMSWGHAASRDLVHWADLPLAIAEEPDKGFTIFSGSAVVDKANTSRLGDGRRPPLVAVYTADYRDERNSKGILEDIHIAFSIDGGRTFSQYAGNPVLHAGDAKFGDPKVFWHDGSGQWVMVTIFGHEQGKVVLYGSPDLKTWRELSAFEAPEEAPGIWECPDLFPLAIDGDPRRGKWLLKTNIVSGAREDRSRYFVGQFDGRQFVRDAGRRAIVPERGDLYAEVTFNGLAGGRQVLIGWMRQQASAERSWTGMQSVGRELSLRTVAGEVRLCQWPAAELKRLRGAAVQASPSATGAAIEAGREYAPAAAGSELDIEAELDTGDATRCGLRLRLANSESTVGYDAARRELFIERAGAGRLALPFEAAAGRLRLRLLVDRSVVEVFAGGGEAALSAVLEPDAVCGGVAPFAEGGQARLLRLSAWPMASIWPE